MNTYGNDNFFRLYRNVKDLFHPAISKLNISYNSICFRDDLFSCRVFYPRRVSSIKQVIIYVVSDYTITHINNYNAILKSLSIATDKLIIGIDNNNDYDNLDKLYNTISFLYDELADTDIDITFMGDSSGSSLLIYTICRMLDAGYVIDKNIILLNPLILMDYSNSNKYRSLSLNKKYIDRFNKFLKDNSFSSLESTSVFPKTTVVVGELDPVKDECREFCKNTDNSLVVIKGTSHDIINSRDLSVRGTLINICR